MYNASEFLSQALNSVLEQTLTDIEVICIDDGSTDATLDICRAYAKQDPRIRILTQNHLGVCAARNAGIDAATGEFLCFYDSDDFFINMTFAESTYNAAIKNNQLVSGASLYNFRAPDKFETSFDHPFYKDYIFEEDKVIAFDEFQFDYGFTRHLYSRKLFEDGRNRFGNLSFFEDTTWMVRILHEAQTFAAVSDTAYVYRCDYRPIVWKTQKVLDLLTGVAINLDFSKEHDLPKLHWYTAHHFDEAAHYIGAGLLPSLDTAAIEKALREVETHIDRSMLAQIDPQDASYVPVLRKSLGAARALSPLQRKVKAKAFLAKRAITPLYHRLTR